jgi:hypothetical protein
VQEKPIQNHGYIKEDLNPCEVIEAFISKKESFRLVSLLSLALYLYTSSVATIDYQSIEIVILVEL